MQIFAKNVTFHRFGKVLVKMFGAFSFKVLRCNKLGTSNKQNVSTTKPLGKIGGQEKPRQRRIWGSLTQPQRR